MIRSRTGRVARVAARAALPAAALLCLAAALATGARAGWLEAKAVLAQALLERAWLGARTSATAEPGKPWPWADVRAVARLSAPAHNVSLVVLDDASGEALAFGPGLVAGDPTRAHEMGVALGGHRDTHLAFLENVAPGTELHLQSADGRTHRFLADPGRVIDVRRETLAIATDAPGLVLVTCWPFDAPDAGGPLRWAVTASAAP